MAGKTDSLALIMEKIGNMFADIAPIFINMVLSLLVAVCVAFAVVGYVHYKDAKLVHAKLFAASIIIVSLFFVAMIFWFFIVKLSLKGV